MTKVSGSRAALQLMCILIVFSCTAIAVGCVFSLLAIRDDAPLGNLTFLVSAAALLLSGFYSAFKARQLYRHIDFIVGMSFHSGDWG